MHGSWKLLTWATAIVSGLMISGMLYGFSRLIDRNDEFVKHDLGSLVFAIAVGFSMQIGLFISPLVIGRNIFLRILSFILMTPFIYFVLFHEIAELGRQIINFDNYYLESWRINLKSHLISTVMTLVCSVVYGYNIILLLFRPSVSRANHLDNIAEGNLKDLD